MLKVVAQICKHIFCPYGCGMRYKFVAAKDYVIKCDNCFKEFEVHVKGAEDAEARDKD